MIDFKSLGKCDLHMHTTYCDGKSSAEQMVLSAIEKGLDTVGVATHSFTSMDNLYCIKKEDIKPFQQEVRALKEKYKDKIRVLCGVEQEYISNCSTDGFDYVIGSVHYFIVDEKYSHVDHSPEYFHNSVKKFFGGDYYAAAENYFSLVENVVEKTGADIIGHFDLVDKFNEGGKLFDVNHPRYVAAYQKALDKLLKTGKPFEINTGAISRGYRTAPYPHENIYKIIKERGGKFILSSDAHHADNVAYQFDIWQKLL